MDKINQIFLNDKYKNYLDELNLLEKDRKFCRHNINHFLDFSRILYIKVLEENLNISKDVIYAIGLLHDIGRVIEYKYKIDHHKGSLIIAKEILKDTSYTKEETEIILKGIECHRDIDKNDVLCNLVYYSDKKSRKCFNCKSIDECYWSDDKKNFIIEY